MMNSDQIVEELIVTQVVDKALKQDYELEVYVEDDEVVLKPNKKKSTIIKTLLNYDLVYLFFFKNKRQIGWVRFIYGNTGLEVINDYSINLAPLIHSVMNKYRQT